MKHPPLADPPRTASHLDPQGWVDRHGDYLYRYAAAKVGRAAAEDLVQETLLAAWRGRAKYGGRASERS